MKRRGLNLDLLDNLIERIANRERLEPRYHDHELVGVYKGLRECHIQPDWLLIYSVDDENKVITLVTTGSHSDLF